MQKVNKILQLCFEINSFEQRSKDLTGDKPTIFVFFSGHISQIKVQTNETGWTSDTENDVEFVIYLHRPFEEIKEQLDSCIQYLEELKERCFNAECL